jgi:hypothetical protein
MTILAATATVIKAKRREIDSLCEKLLIDGTLVGLERGGSYKSSADLLAISLSFA